MGLKNLLLFLLLFGFCFSPVFSAPKNYEKLKDGVLVYLEDEVSGEKKFVKIRVISDNIIQVISGDGNEVPDIKSLMIVDDIEGISEWEYSENGDDIILNTNRLQVLVSGSTGAVKFLDKDGKLLTEEVGASVRKSLPSNENLPVSTYFSAADEEAFYGLGQHQTALMNYRGYQVDLTQYNGVAVVPFVVSSKKYGILWDNNAITKFGDIREYQPLSAFKLYSEDNRAGGLTATYNFDPKVGKEPIVKQENVIDYEFLNSLKQLPEDYSMAGGEVTWNGFIESAVKGDHTFLLHSAGYVKIWIDGKLLVDKWREAWNPGPAIFKYALGKNKKHRIKIEWDPDGGESYIALRFLTPQDEAAKSKVGFASEAGKAVNYYFVNGQDLDEVISGYRTLTGAAQVMPKWAMGFWQSRERYKTQDEILKTVAEFRKRDIPLDNIVLDWSYWEEDQWGSHEFDASRFPDPEGMIETLHEKYNTHIMISVWPKFYEGTENYKELNEKGLLYTQNIKNQQRDWIGKGYVSTFYDAYNPEAREVFWKQMNEKLYSKGIDAWWLDATEPDILSNASIEHRKTLMNPNALGTATQYFNAYSLMNAKGIYKGQRKENPDDRVFILTRSAFAGLQRYGAATWSGDISSTFKEMGRQISAGLNFALSGLPYWTTDIGGFFVENKYDRPDPKGEALEEWRELNARWFQFGAFTPLFRAHGQYPHREVFNIAPEDHRAYQSMVYYNKLRYRLIPYIYSLAGMVYHDDYTIMRALVMDFGADNEVTNIGDQFMFGPNLLINPVYEYKATKRELYLPENTGWYNLYDGTYVKGGQEIVADAPYERMPIYVKEGAIIPFGPEIEYTTEKPADIITLYVYGGKDGQFSVYEDENTNYNYEEGKFLRIPISYKEETKTLTIGDQEGEGFEGMLQQRTFKVIYVSKDQPQELEFDRASDKEIKYSGKSQSIKLI